MEDNNEVKIIIRPVKDGTYAIYIVEPKGTEPMTEKMASCYTIARGMIKFGLETPDIAFDYGLMSFQEDKKLAQVKANGKSNGNYNDIKKTGNVIDITKLLKRKDEE